MPYHLQVAVLVLVRAQKSCLHRADIGCHNLPHGEAGDMLLLAHGIDEIRTASAAAESPYSSSPHRALPMACGPNARRQSVAARGPPRGRTAVGQWCAAGTPARRARARQRAEQHRGGAAPAIVIEPAATAVGGPAAARIASHGTLHF